MGLADQNKRVHIGGGGGGGEREKNSFVLKSTTSLPLYSTNLFPLSSACESPFGRSSVIK